MRIAVVFSGEARTFNAHTASHWLRWKEAVESVSDIELIFYGHTWDHCPDHEIPNSEILPLSDIWIDSENIISDWICKDFSNRHFRNPEDKIDTEIDFKDNKTKIEFIDKVLLRSALKWGQFVSTWISFSKLPKEEYQTFDGFIRARWDCYVPLDEEALGNIIKKINSMRNFFIKSKKDKIYASDILNNVKRVSTFILNVTPNDVMYYVTKSGMDAFIDNDSVEDFMNQIIPILNSTASSQGSHTFFVGMMSIKKLDFHIVENDTSLDLFKAKIARPHDYKK